MDMPLLKKEHLLQVEHEELEDVLRKLSVPPERHWLLRIWT